MGAVAPSRAVGAPLQLRQIEAVEPELRQNAQKIEVGTSALLIPLIAGGALAPYNPKIGFAVGGLTLASSAIFKKGWASWLVGSVILVLALFFWLCTRIRRGLHFKPLSEER
jgi:hypothetical protein